MMSVKGRGIQVGMVERRVRSVARRDVRVEDSIIFADAALLRAVEFEMVRGEAVAEEAASAAEDVEDVIEIAL